jgi:CheY-like chemotaxis protein
MEALNAGKDNICVAVVDDDESACRSLSRLLRLSGLQPVTYRSAEDFLEDAKRPRFDCLLLDVQLQGISAHDEPEVRAEALASGCAGFFRKTDSAELVLSAIRRASGFAPADTARPTLK